MIETPQKLAIMQRIQANLDVLTQDGAPDPTARRVQRKSALIPNSPVTPAIYDIAYPERMIEQDTVCLTLQFTLIVQLFFVPGRDPGEVTDRFEASVQAAIEKDIQLGGLVDYIEYQSNNPFVLDDDTTDGGTVMEYTIQYRRARGAPDRTYT